MKSAKTNLPALALVAFVATVFALLFLFGRQPPGSTANDIADAKPAVEETATAQETADKAEEEAAKRRRATTNFIINTAVFNGVPVLP